MTAPSAPISALAISGLVKKFGDFTAVSSIDLGVPVGRFEAFLGANGAGKTTCMRMIAGLLAPSAGDISVFGINIAQDPMAAKAICAFLPDEPLVYDRMSPWEYLELIGGLWNMDPEEAKERASTLLEQLDLYDQRHTQCEGFSRGMRQKTAMAGALLHRPKLLLMDEPFSGLDAAITRQVKDLLAQLLQEGSAILLTTHVMDVAERLADHLTIINKGSICARGTFDELRAQDGRANASLEDIFIRLIDG